MLIRIFLWILSINWEKYRPASCFPNHCFCETITHGFIRQPVNAYTNLAYIIIGIYILIYLFHTRSNRQKKNRITGLSRKIFILFGLASIAVGIGSFIYHAGFTFLGMELDDDTMYLIGSFMLFWGCAHIQSMSVRRFLLFYFLLNICLELIIYFFPVLRGPLFGLLVLGSILIDRLIILYQKTTSQVKYLVWGVGLFTLGYLVWIPDYTKQICVPNSIIQGHAIWHVLTALAILMIFLYMDSEYI